MRERQALMVSAKGSNDCGIALDVAGFEVVPAGVELVPVEGLGREGALAPVGRGAVVVPFGCCMAASSAQPDRAASRIAQESADNTDRGFIGASSSIKWHIRLPGWCLRYSELDG